MNTVTGEVYAILDHLDEAMTITLSRRDITNLYIALVRQIVKDNEDAAAFNGTMKALSKALTHTNY